MDSDHPSNMGQPQIQHSRHANPGVRNWQGNQFIWEYGCKVEGEPRSIFEVVEGNGLEVGDHLPPGVFIGQMELDEYLPNE